MRVSARAPRIQGTGLRLNSRITGPCFAAALKLTHAGFTGAAAPAAPAWAHVCQRCFANRCTMLPNAVLFVHVCCTGAVAPAAPAQHGTRLCKWPPSALAKAAQNGIVHAVIYIEASCRKQCEPGPGADVAGASPVPVGEGATDWPCPDQVPACASADWREF